MASREISPVLKFALELGPIAAFFVGYLRLRDETFTIAGSDYSGFIIVTAAFIPVLLAATAALWALTGKLSRMQVVTAVLVIVFGGLTVAFNDERFFKMKPSIIYGLFAAVLAVGLARGQSYLRFVMEELVPLDQTGWMKLTRRVTAFFILLMVANEIVWRTMSTDAWVNFKTFGLPIATMGFFLAQGPLFARHGPDEPDTSG